jgi:hypothetical protein
VYVRYNFCRRCELSDTLMLFAMILICLDESKDESNPLEDDACTHRTMKTMTMIRELLLNVVAIIMLVFVLMLLNNCFTSISHHQQN